MNFFYYLCWNFISTKADVIWNEKTIIRGIEWHCYKSFSKIGKINGFFYWFSGNVPNNIILETKTKRQISYIQPQIIGFYDPLFWFFIYNRETGEVYQLWR